MFKKILFILVFSLLFISPFKGVSAESPELVEVKEALSETIYVLSSPGCPHCTDAKRFFLDFQEDNLLVLNISDNDISQNLDLAKDLYEKYNVPKNRQGLVPAIFIGDEYFIGFNQQTATEINSLLLEKKIDKKSVVKIPFIGEVNLLSMSLPVLSVVLGIVDGFNVCSLGALVIILGLVMVLKSRRRIFLLGGAFLLTTALVYGLMIFLWHQFFTIITPFIKSFELLIGLFSIIGGLYLLREFYKAYKSGPVCSSNNLMSRLSPKIEKIFKNKTNYFVLFGAVVLFAAVVTIVEFPCSAVVPVLFTGILVDSGISLNLSLFYISLFLLFYLLDEIIIFAIAVLTMKIKIVSPKFIIFFNLLAAAIFLFLGVYYIINVLS